MVAEISDRMAGPVRGADAGTLTTVRELGCGPFGTWRIVFIRRRAGPKMPMYTRLIPCSSAAMEARHRSDNDLVALSGDGMGSGSG